MGLVDRKDDSQASKTSNAIINLFGQCGPTLPIMSDNEPFNRFYFAPGFPS